MNTSLYRAAAEELRGNPEQWQAYESKGNCVILAGPGSGKTKVITTKIARLLSEDLRLPRRVACITYSNACVTELRSRLRKLAVADDPRISLSTVHSFCLTELVLPYARLAGLNVADPLVVSTPLQSAEIFARAYKQTLGGQPPGFFRLEFDRLRRTVLDRNSTQWKNWPGRETEVAPVYETLLAKSGLIDFDGLVLTGLRLVEDYEWIRQCVKAKYPVIVVDEYQDLGLPLHRIVMGLKEAGVRIVAVGDPDQSIYGFTGAKPGLLRTLARAADVQKIELQLNYRCADQIITASTALLANATAFKSHDGRKGDLRIFRVKQDVRGQATFVLRDLVHALLKANPGWKYGDIALLYRSFYEGNMIAEVADALKLRYFRADNGSPIKRTRLIEWLTDAAKWGAGGWKSGTVKLNDILRGWQSLRRSLTKPTEALAARTRLISMLFSFRTPAASLYDWLAALDKAALREALTEESGLADERDNFDQLLESAKDGTLKHYTVEVFGNQGRSAEQINFMTLHGSKGLEFEAVVILGLEQGAFPSTRDNTEEKLAEVSRLFYVGLTRAKNSISLTYGSNESPLITKIRAATKPKTI